MIRGIYSETLSTEVRKIVIGLIITVFGLAYKDGDFKLYEFLSLRIALILFFIYLLLDIFHYLYGIIMEKNGKKPLEVADKVYPIFVGKLSIAILGLISCGLNLVFGF